MARKVHIKIYELLEKKNISLRKLSLIADINHSILINLGKGRKQQISIAHIERISEALDIDDISEIIEIIQVQDEQ